MNEPTITVVGNLTADPELRYTSSGLAVANFTIAATPRVKQGDQWVDGEALFMRCSVWREHAENVAGSLAKGMRVMATGALKATTWEKNGEKRHGVELQVEEVGPALRYATATVQRTQAGAGGQQGGQQRAQQRGQGQEQWAQPASAGQSDPWAQPGVYDDDTPF